MTARSVFVILGTESKWCSGCFCLKSSCIIIVDCRKQTKYGFGVSSNDVISHTKFCERQFSSSELEMGETLRHTDCIVISVYLFPFMMKGRWAENQKAAVIMF
jgi:hypothetical protein